MGLELAVPTGTLTVAERILMKVARVSDSASRKEFKTRVELKLTVY